MKKILLGAVIAMLGLTACGSHTNENSEAAGTVALEAVKEVSAAGKTDTANITVASDTENDINENNGESYVEESAYDYLLMYVGTKEDGNKTDNIYILELDDSSLSADNVGISLEKADTFIKARSSVVAIHPGKDTDTLIGNYDASIVKQNAKLYTLAISAEGYNPKRMPLTADLTNSKTGETKTIQLDQNAESYDDFSLNEACVMSGVFLYEGTPILIETTSLNTDFRAVNNSYGKGFAWTRTMTVTALSDTADISEIKNSMVQDITPVVWNANAGTYISIEKDVYPDISIYAEAALTNPGDKSKTFAINYGYLAKTQDDATQIRNYLVDKENYVVPKIQTDSQSVILGCLTIS